MVKRSAFSLIELILSIVIVAIVSLSLPLVMKLTSQINAKAMTQESIMNAKTYMSLILKAPFSSEVVSTYKGTLTPKFYDGGNTFYEQFGLNGDGRRAFYNRNNPSNLVDFSRTDYGTINDVQDNVQKSVDDFSAKEGLTINDVQRNVKKSVDDFRTKEGLTINYDKDSAKRLKRDYIVSSRYSVDINDGSTAFNDVANDIKEVVINATSYSETNHQVQVVLRGFVANIGDSGFLINKEWN